MQSGAPCAARALRRRPRPILAGWAQARRQGATARRALSSAAGWHPTERCSAHFSWDLVLLLQFPAPRCKNFVAIEATWPYTAKNS